MKSHSEMKQDYEFQNTVTDTDIYFYKEPAPLTEEQKLFLLHKEEEIKQKYYDQKEFERRWKEKYYSDKTDKEL